MTTLKALREERVASSTTPMGRVRRLAQRRTEIFRWMLTFGLAGVIAAFVIPAEYTSTSTILPPQQGQSIAANLLGNIGLAGSLLTGKDLGVKNPSDLWVGILKSRTIADRLVDQFDLRRMYGKKTRVDARKKLAKRTDIHAGKDGIISVGVVDHDPKLAAALANGYIESLYEVNKDLAITEAAQRRLFFENQLKKVKGDLAESEVAFKQAQERTGLIQVEGQAKATIESIAGLQAQIRAKEMQLRGMRTYASNDNPQVQRTQEELAALRSSLGKLQSSEKSVLGDPEIPMTRVPEAGLEYVRRYRDFKYQETLYEMVARQLEVAKLDESKEAPMIQVIDTAVPAEKKSFPPRTAIILGCLVAGALLAVIYYEVLEKNTQSLWREFRSPSSERS